MKKEIIEKIGNRLTNDGFIVRAKSTHGDKYTYQNTAYTGYKNKVIITCSIHGDFEQTASDHINGRGCQKCGLKKSNKNLNKMKTTEQFINEANIFHNNKFKYDKTVYKGALDKVIITCPIHGDFEQTAANHLKFGCSKCNTDKKRSNTMEFIEKSIDVHGAIYDYSKTKYRTAKRKVIITCPIHGDFRQVANKHLSGRGCPICRNSKGELRIRKFLKKHNTDFIQEHSFDDCFNKRPLRFDFYLPDLNICIEYDGEHHFEAFRFNDEKRAETDLKNTQNNDSIKNKYCKDNNIKLIRIPHWNFNKIEKILKEELYD